jgi:hypothetical protein
MFSRLVRPLSFLGSLIVPVALIIMGSSMAFAADPNPTETIGAGGMVVAGTFTAGNNTLTLDGSNHTASVIGTLAVTADDFTGSGAGWTLTTSATPLSSASGEHILATSLATSGIGTSALACAVKGATCSTTGVTTSTIPLDGTAQTLAAATATNGMGSYTFTDNLVVDIPADAFVGTYSSTITFTMVSL